MRVNAFGTVLRVAFVAWSLFCIWKGCGKMIETPGLDDAVTDAEHAVLGAKLVGTLIAWLVIWLIPSAVIGLAYGVLGRSRAE